MKHRYLEVTFRKGKPIAAYLLAELNEVLVRHGQTVLDDEEWAPLAA
jgi:hypothetical protein